MDAVGGIGLRLGYVVPFLWFDDRRKRERFAVETLTMPVRIRAVAPETIEKVWLDASPVSQVMAHMIEEERYVGYLGCPIEGIVAPEAKPTVLSCATAHLPIGLAPQGAEARREANRMRAASIEHPGAMAAARFLRIAEEDLVHDGRFLYERHRAASDPALRAAERAASWLRQCCCDVVHAGERALRAHPGDTALSEQLSLLRRAMLPTLFHGLPEADRPTVESLVRQAALMLAESHPTDRQRAAMSRIADSFPDPPLADEEAFAGLTP